MTHLVVIRPEPGCAATLAAAHVEGLKAQGFPLFAVTQHNWAPPPPESVDALLIGSANALRHGGPLLETLRSLPVYAVGETTAAAARAAGFTIAMTGSGGLQQVLARIASGTRLLRLAGEERVELTPPAGVTMIERVVYASTPLPMPPKLAGLCRKGAVVLLHSAEAARHFAAECDRLDIDRAGIALAALGPRIADAAGTGWADVRSAEEPRDAALLALARQMCQSAR